MPLPLLIVVPALLVAAGAGIKKANDGRLSLRDAKDIQAAAMEKYSKEEKLLGRSDKRRLKAEQDLGDARKRVFDDSVPEFITMVSRLRNAENVSEVASGAFQADDIPMSEVKKIALQQLDLLGTAAGAAIASAAVGTASIEGAAAFGLASTGTAISGLSGAAANSALLAWFGGGTLAAGGGGMAAGTMVIGGIVAAPAILVGGIVFSQMMDKKLEEARENAAEVGEYCAKAQAQRLLFNEVARACRRGTSLISLGSDRLEKWTTKLNGAADKEADVKKWSKDDHDRLMAAANLAGLLVGAASIPHVNENGRINKQFLVTADHLND